MKTHQEELEQLRKELAYYKNLLAIMPGHVYWQDRNSRFLGCNIGQAKSAGLVSPEQIVGTTPHDHLSIRDANAVTKTNLEVMENDVIKLIEETTVFADGINRTFLDHKLPIKDEEGKVIGVLGVSYDITEKKQLENALQQSHAEAKKTSEMLSNIIDLIPGHVYWLDKNNVLLGCNQKTIDAFGVTDKELIINHSLYDLFPKEDVDQLVAINNHIMATGIAETMEEEGLFQGQYRSFLSKKSPMRDSLGNIIGTVGVSIDITAEKQLGRELQLTQTKVKETEATLENIISLLPGHVYWKDREGRYLGCNELQAKSAGHASRATYIGKTDYADLSEEDADKVRAADLQVMESGENLTIEETVTLPSGQTRVYLSEKAPLRNANTEIIGIQGVSFDITERKALEQELYLAKQRAESALEHVIAIMPGHVFWEDLAGMVLGCNDSLATALGLTSRQELVGKVIYDYLTPAEADEQRALSQEVINSGEPKKIERYFTMADGSERILLSHKTPLRDQQGKIVGLLDTAVDITERKQMERALQEAKEKAETASLAKTDFIASMSHDFRTPLNGVIGLAEILLMRVKEPEYREFIQNIYDCGKVIANLIENILNYAQIEAGRYELQIKPFDLREVVEHVITMIAPQAQQKEIELLVTYSWQVPHLVYNDPLAINRILINLIGNALKFTDRGHIAVTISCLEQTNNQAKLCIIIEDTGIGIPANRIDQIFERFNRSEPSYASKYKGSGLGLAIVEKLVTALNGTIMVTSEIDKGSRFTVTLPFSLQQDAPFNKELPVLLNILIIDEYSVRGKLFCQQFAPHHCTIYSAEQAVTELLTIKQAGKFYHMVIIDERVAKNQPELISQFKAKFEQAKPFIILATCGCSLPEREYYQDLGVDKILIKPLRPSELNLQIKLLQSAYQQGT